MANITYNIYRRYSKTEKPIPVATGLVNPTYEIPNIDYDRDVYLSVGRVTNKLEVYGEEYKYFIPFETPTIEASYADGVITVNWIDNPIYVDDLYLYTSSELITDDALPPPIILNKGVKSTTVNKVLAVDEVLCIRLGSVRNNNIKLTNEVMVSVFEAPYDVVADFKDDAINLSWNLDGFVDKQVYYISESPIDVNNLPEPKIILGGDDRSYIDLDVEIGKTYYVRVGSVKTGVEKISNELLVSTYNLIQTGVLGFYYGVNQASITENGKRFLAKSAFNSWVHFGINTARNASSSAYYAEVTLSERTLQYGDSLSLGVSTISNPVASTGSGSNGMYQYQSGGIFKANNSSKSYAVGFIKGDKVGVLINKNSSGNTDVTFYKNGVSLGVATTLSGTPNLYMMISLYNSNFNLNVDLLLAGTVMPKFAFPVLAW